MCLDRNTIFPRGMTGIIKTLATYGKVSRFCSDDQIEYVLHPSRDDMFTITGRMMVYKKEALLSLYDNLEAEMWTEVQLIESGILGSK